MTPPAALPGPRILDADAGAARLVPLAVAVLPPLVLAAIGLVHPMELTPSTAEMWRDMHIALLPLFPLLALGPWLVVRRSMPRLAWVAALLGYIYAAFYSALDLLAGVGAGALQVAGHPDGIGTLYRAADALAVPGTVALLAASVVAGGVVIGRVGWIAVPGTLLVSAAGVSYLTSHIFAPRGVLTMVAFAAGWTLLLLVDRPKRRGNRAAPGTATAVGADGPSRT